MSQEVQALPEARKDKETDFPVTLQREPALLAPYL